MLNWRLLFDTADFPPRWRCGHWTPLHGWTHIVSDVAIFGAYAMIPLTLAYFVFKRKDVPFPPVFWLFALFIFSCGFGHLIDATLFWNPWYRLWGTVKLLTAIASWATVIALLRVMPEAIRLPGMVVMNQQLATEVAERQRAEERFRNVVESAPNAIVLVDSAGRISLLNRQLEALFGYRREELLGQNIDILVPERYRGQHPGHRTPFFASPQTRAMGAGRDLFGLRKDGTEVPIEIGLNPVKTAEGVSVLASVIDITERKRAENVMRASLAVKETLLQEIHHRVKNNLQVISSLLQLQADDARDPALVTAFQGAQQRIRAMALVHEKLYQSHDGSGIDFADYLHSLLTQLVRSAKRGSAAVRTELDLQPVLLNVDIAISLGLIVTELVTNSLKYAFQNREEGRLRVSLGSAPNGWHRLDVMDDGPGLPPDMDSTKGSTTGLRLVHDLTRQIGGVLSIGKEGGASFSLLFCATYPTTETPSPPGADAQPQSPTL
ncbi:MAG: PAS domain S-box protein [Lentisphaerae bacterium]|nr:PAS domain S-box protein [Lentisphaerota bacterium]